MLQYRIRSEDERHERVNDGRYALEPLRMLPSGAGEPHGEDFGHG
ncbi:hypothetical protein GGE67_001965 [Rhizobium leucaenae]|uniref:Uncharacterized protein n=1 Tax=Rhizobium leucaenae TaxID=29450 RepID=A0A7W6ZQL9_9HYPH|nr:hypothetical protein [Rhizobium leucaenae]MBB6301356.1 hypothetical protein [Rhizobium leucaenae]